MAYRPRPHLSSALAHLRFSVYCCAGVLALALGAQIVVFVIVHFTDARTQHVGEGEPTAARVVTTPPRAQVSGAPKNAEELAAAPARADVNQVPGESDVLLRRSSIVVQWAGVMSALLLSGLMFQAVMLGGAGLVPGVERAVSAGTMVMVVVLCCLPLSGLLPETPFRGVFVGYERLVNESTLSRAGDASAPSGMMLYGAHVFMPAALLAALLVSIARFRAGIEAGVIATSVSELNEKLEREIRAMKGDELATPRAIGALNFAIGTQPTEEEMRLAAGAESIRVAPPAFRTADAPSALAFNPGDSTKRPI